MQVHVRLFAVVRDRAGLDRLELELPDGATVQVAASELSAKLPSLSDVLARVAYAVNHEYAPLHQVLQDDDELAVIPAVSGGAGAFP